MIFNGGYNRKTTRRLRITSDELTIFYYENYKKRDSERIPRFVAQTLREDGEVEGSHLAQ